MTITTIAETKHHSPPSFPDVQLHAGPESILPVVIMDSGLALRAPRNDESFGLVSI
jgi:hypothetical protein